MPRLLPNDLATLRLVMRMENDEAIRYAFVRGEFIIYDAFAGACTAGQRYRVINGGCNETYEPYDLPDHTFPAIGPGCINPPLPRSVVTKPAEFGL